MALSEAKLAIQDGGLGILQATGDQVVCKVGLCTLGTPLTPYFLTDQSQVLSVLGYGPLADACVAALQIPGNGGVLAVPVTQTTAGTAGSTAKANAVTTPGTGTYTFGGAPNDAYQFQAKVVTAGTNLAAATGAFVLSVDGGKTFGPPIAIPVGGVYTIPTTGATLTFVDGSGTSYQVNDTATSQAVAPAFTNADMIAAIQAANTNTSLLDFALIHVVGQAATVSASATQFAALDGLMSTFEAGFNYYRAYIEIADDTDANIASAFAAVLSSSKRVGAVAGFVDLAEQDSTIRRRHAAWAALARAGAVKASEDLGKVKTGGLRNVQKLYRDESTATTPLDTLGILTLRTYKGRTGQYFVSRPNLMVASTSDYRLLQRGRVSDIAAKIIRNKGLNLLRDDVPVNNATGFILEEVAQAYEADFKTALDGALLEKRDASATKASIRRNTNLLSDPTIYVTFTVTPKSTVEQVSGTLAFKNPALVAV